MKTLLYILSALFQKIKVLKLLYLLILNENEYY